MRPVRPTLAARARAASLAALPVAGLVLCGLAAALPAGAAQQSSSSKQPVYKWVDEQGVTHYGDAIPPQYKDQDKTVINRQGVQVGTIPGRRTPEQLEQESRARNAEQHAQQEQVLARQRDQNLLATYLTVEEIESLRDRRLDILNEQSKVTNQYVETLRGRMKQLVSQAQRFKPYSADTKAGPMPEHLAQDLVRTVNEIRAQEKSLTTRQQDAMRLQEQFTRDIARFRELKKIESEYARNAQPRT